MCQCVDRLRPRAALPSTRLTPEAIEQYVVVLTGCW